MMNKKLNHEAAKAAFTYGGAYPSMVFAVSDAKWRWDDTNESIALGHGDARIKTDTAYPNNFYFLFYQSPPSGPSSVFYPDFDEMRWNGDIGILTIQGKTKTRRPYTCWVTVTPGR